MTRNVQQRCRPVAALISFALLLIAFLLRAYRLDHHVLWLDETIAATIASQPIDQIFARLRSNQADPPLYHLLLHWWIPIAGSGAFSLRWPSVLAGALLVAVVNRLGKDLAGRRTGLIAAALAAISPLAIWYAQEARMYAQLMLYVALVLLGLVRFCRQPSRAALAISVGSAVLALLSHYEAPPVLVGVWAVGVALVVAGRCSRRRLALFGLGQAVALAPFGLWLLSARTLVPPFQSGHFTGGVSPALEYAVAGPAIVVSPSVGMRLTIVSIAALACSLAWVAVRRRAGLLWPGLLLLLMAVPAVEFIAVPRLAPMLGPRYLSVFLPELLILVSIVAMLLWPRGRCASALLLALFLVGAGTGYYAYQFDPRYGKWYDYRPIAAYIKAHGRGSDAVIVNSAYDPSFWYLYHRVDNGDLPAIDLSNQANATLLPAVLATADQSYERLWLAPDGGGFWGNHDAADRWLQEQDEAVGTQNLAGMSLSLYRTSLGLLDADNQPAHAELGHSVSLAGWSMVRLAPAKLAVVLDWRAMALTALDYTVFVHLYDVSGRLVAQNDGQPAFGVSPTSRWRVGQRVIDQHQVALPARLSPGSYRLTTGLYVLSSGRRLLLSGPGASGDEVALGTVVLPDLP